MRKILIMAVLLLSLNVKSQNDKPENPRWGVTIEDDTFSVRFTYKQWVEIITLMETSRYLKYSKQSYVDSIFIQMSKQIHSK